MPAVDLVQDIAAPADRVWAAIVDIERYPLLMQSVTSVEVLARDGDRRRSAWTVRLQGATLRWEELEQLDADARELRFSQVAGDLSDMEGAWTVRPLDEGRCRVRLALRFEIGIPLVARLLDGVAARALEQNCRDMFTGIEREARGVASP